MFPEESTLKTRFRADETIYKFPTALVAIPHAQPSAAASAGVLSRGPPPATVVMIPCPKAGIVRTKSKRRDTRLRRYCMAVHLLRRLSCRISRVLGEPDAATEIVARSGPRRVTRRLQGPMTK